MQVTATPAPNSSVLLEIEVPADRLDRAVRDAVGRLSRRTRVAGFRPGKAPRPILERVLGPGAVLDEAVEHLVQDSYREAIVEQDIVPLTNADVEVVEAIEGKPLRFKATVQVRPEVELGDYQNFKFKPEIETVDEPKIDNVVEELRDQNATLAAVEERGAKNGDWAVIGFAGTKDGVPFDGGTTERMPLIIGEDRLIPGFEANLIGLKAGDSTAFDITFPDDYPEETLAGQQVHFAVDLKELREKVLPEADDAFAQSMGDYADLADPQGRHRRAPRAATPSTGPATSSATRSSTTPSPTRPSSCPTILVDQEVEVMHDEFRATLARQGISEPAYLKATEKTEADLHAEFRPRAEQRVKVLLVLSKIAETEDIDVRDADVEAQVELARERYAERPEDRRATSSPSAAATSSAARCAGRRSVETLVDRWLAAHPDHPAAAAPRGRRRAVGVEAPRGRGRRIHRRHRSGLHPGATAAAAAER